jgi:sugar (pentulose or hexulose) kinase
VSAPRGPYVIGCDVGSQGTNAALYAADGTLVASAYEPYDVAFPHPTWAEQDARLWTAALHATIAQLLRSRACRSARSSTAWWCATPPASRCGRR